MSYKPSYPCTLCGTPKAQGHEMTCPISALKSCVQAIKFIEQTNGITFEPWSYVANSVRQAEAALESIDEPIAMKVPD